jgi:hypothetical protein
MTETAPLLILSVGVFADALFVAGLALVARDRSAHLFRKKEATMTMPRYAPRRRHPIGDESGPPSAITGSDIVAAWLGVLFILAAVMTTIFFR